MFFSASMPRAGPTEFVSPTFQYAVTGAYNCPLAGPPNICMRKSAHRKQATP